MQFPRILSMAAAGAMTLVLGFTALAPAQTRSHYDQARRHMVENVIISGGVTDPRVVQAALATPRHEFVPLPHRRDAYYDMALPIGDQQTISSPFIVAFMTQALDPQPSDRVLEIGTGSGYQAAILSPLVKEVYTIEIVESLGRRAERTLRRLRYNNVFVKVGDGFQGWTEHAPFDKIIVTCSPEKVPQPLVDQLKEGGLMVIPVGERYQQTLYIMRKTEGELRSEALRPTLFVPMTGTAESSREVQPDPLNPQVVNGDFEQGLGEDGFLAGWYYERQLTLQTDPDSSRGKYVTFRNQQPGRSAHVLQGFPIDGRQIGELELSASIRLNGVQPGRQPDELPMVAVTFYDGNRKQLGHWWVGPFRGSHDWQTVQKRVPVPPQAREGILRIGLFGGIGEISYDNVQMAPVARRIAG